ncbi:MAG: DPP IV N-terminal domain-containing protein, partial [Bacteroidota bacterium]
MLRTLFCCFLLTLSFKISAQQPNFSYLDIFDLQYATDPQISPDGEWIVYRRMGFDIMKDRTAGNLWLLRKDGSNHQKLTTREVSERGARWSPQGDRIVFSSGTDEGTEIFMYWVASGKIAKLTQLPYSPSSMTWSPDGKQLAFSMNVPKALPVIAKIPKKPKGAKWADAARITDRVYHEADGRGYIKPGFNHIFVMPSNGGAVRQITSGDYHHRGTLSWGKDGKHIYFSANRNNNWEYDFRNSEVYSVSTETGAIEALTDRNGPDSNPTVSPDGKYIAYLGFEDKVQAHQGRKLQLMAIDGSNKREISTELDRTLSNIQWDAKSGGLYIYYDDKGNGKISHISLSGKVTEKVKNVGGTTLGRPYASGSYSVSKNGTIAFTQSTPEYPAELAILDAKKGST